MRTIVVLLVLCFVVKAQTPPPVAGKVLDFAIKNMGKKVDRGECWDLANAALNSAGADWESPHNFGDKVNYKKDGFKPGDVMQFSNIKMEYPNGKAAFPKHTAIVYKAKDNNRVTLIHQNFNNKRFVDTVTINLDYIKSGTVEVFRPKGKFN